MNISLSYREASSYLPSSSGTRCRYVKEETPSKNHSSLMNHKREKKAASRPNRKYIDGTLSFNIDIT